MALLLAFLCLAIIAFSLRRTRIKLAGGVLSSFASGLAVHPRRPAARRTYRVVILAQDGQPVAPDVTCKVGRSRRVECVTITAPAAHDPALQTRACDLVQQIRREQANEVLLAFAWSDHDAIRQVAHHLRLLPVRVRLLADLATDAPTRTVDLQRAPPAGMELVLKRVLDLTAGSVLLLFLLPVLLAIIAAVRLDSPGPVLFRQRRIGLHGKPFCIYKFRTMRTLDDGPVVQQACRADARVTRVGAVLRKYSLDELPQLLNVLKGDMSLVGPRPHALAHDVQYCQAIALYAARHKMRPGITGWAQVNGWRGATPQVQMMEQRVQHDLWYIDHWSFWLDIKILARTVVAAWKAQNAF
jgi:Undecaprenyl-phosphate glucose phosphotransferase